MHIPRLAVLAFLLMWMLVGCKREETPAAAPESAPALLPSAPTSTPTPLLEPRSVQLQQSGWRFDLRVMPDGQGGEALEGLVSTVDGNVRHMSALPEGETLAEAFATDLDADGFPELLLWWRSSGSGAEGEVRGWQFSVATTQALALPELDADSALGYRGRDQFGVQGSALVRSFPVYRDDDDNAGPTSGFARVIRYVLANGVLEVAGVSLEPAAGSPQHELLGL